MVNNKKTISDKCGIRNTRLTRHNRCDLSYSKGPVVKVGKDFKAFRRTTPSSVGQVRKEWIGGLS